MYGAGFPPAPSFFRKANMRNDYLYRAKQRITDPQILSIVAARRARQLANGARPMIKTDDQEYLDIALLEIAEDLLGYEIPTPEELEAEKRAAIEAEAAAAEEAAAAAE